MVERSLHSFLLQLSDTYSLLSVSTFVTYIALFDDYMLMLLYLYILVLLYFSTITLSPPGPTQHDLVLLDGHLVPFDDQLHDTT